jgi:hypothetical protein
LGLVWGLAPAAPAQEGSAPPAPAPQVELDKLLQLPTSLDYSVENRGRYTPGEWRSQFQEVREKLESERTALGEAEARLEEVASSAGGYQIAPPIPGMQASADAPLDFQLRQEINRHREEIEHLEHRLQELEIEANLAGVPEEWRH